MSIAIQSYQAVNAAHNRRKQLALQKKAMDAELQRLGYENYNSKTGKFDTIQGSQADFNEQRLAAIFDDINNIKKENSVQKTNSAIEEYQKTGDATIFNSVLKNDKFLQEAWAEKGVVEVANIDFENDKWLLEQAGYNLDNIDDNYKENRIDSLKRSIWKFRDNEGNWQIGSLNNLVAETGYLNYVNNNKRSNMLEAFSNYNSILKGENLNVINRKLGIQEKANEIAKKRTEIYEDSVNKTGSGGKRYANEVALIATQGAQKRIKEIEALNGGKIPEEGSELFEDYREQIQIIAKYNKFNKNKDLDEVIGNISYIAKVSNSDFNTDIYNDILRNIFKVSDSNLNVDEIKDLQQAQALSQVHNVIRHRIFGSALTEHEDKNFLKAFPNLHAQTPAVLTAVLNYVDNAVENIEREISTSVVPELARFHYGGPLKEFKKMQENLNKYLYPDGNPGTKSIEEILKKSEEYMYGKIPSKNQQTGDDENTEKLPDVNPFFSGGTTYP